MPRRQCVRCQHAISDRYPTWLVTASGGRIVGPLHSWCAAALHAEELRGRPALPEAVINAGQVGRIVDDRTR